MGAGVSLGVRCGGNDEVDARVELSGRCKGSRKVNAGVSVAVRSKGTGEMDADVALSGRCEVGGEADSEQLLLFGKSFPQLLLVFPGVADKRIGAIFVVFRLCLSLFGCEFGP